MTALRMRGIPAWILRPAVMTGALAVILVAGTACSGNSSSSQTPDPDRESAAFAVCHSAVKAKVGATGDATFAEEKADSTNFGYKISGTIQTPDGVKTRYLCSAEQNGKDWVGAQIVLNPT
jgi:hypothetical protein